MGRYEGRRLYFCVLIRMGTVRALAGRDNLLVWACGYLLKKGLVNRGF
jgi:hypothetical protein